MSIDETLKENLIADVENILSMNISDENIELLKRCFEITIGHHFNLQPQETDDSGMFMITDDGPSPIEQEKSMDQKQTEEEIRDSDVYGDGPGGQF